MSSSVQSLVNVTTDKVAEAGSRNGYRETNRLDGYDPYSNSKSCSELVTHSYVKAFFGEEGRPRLSPPAVQEMSSAEETLRQTASFRTASEPWRRGEIVVRIGALYPPPYQHVLEPLYMYLTVAMRQYEGVVPLQDTTTWSRTEMRIVFTTGELVNLFCSFWGGDAKWNRYDGGPHEANFLKLDCSRVKKTFGWKPRYHVSQAVEKQ